MNLVWQLTLGWAGTATGAMFTCFGGAA